MGIAWGKSVKAVGFVAAVALVLHLVLLAIWRWSILPELEQAPHSMDAAVSLLDPLPSAPSSWLPVDLCGMRLRAPPPRASDRSLPWPHPPSPGVCTISLDGGWLHAYASPLDKTYWEIAELTAPHSNDVRFWSPPWRNWQMIVAVAWRAQKGSGGISARRFDTATARGAILSLDSRGVKRHVIYAFGDERCGGRLVTVTRAADWTLRRVVASLEVCPVSASRRNDLPGVGIRLGREAAKTTIEAAELEVTRR